MRTINDSQSTPRSGPVVSGEDEGEVGELCGDALLGESPDGGIDDGRVGGRRRGFQRRPGAPELFGGVGGGVELVREDGNEAERAEGDSFWGFRNHEGDLPDRLGEAQIGDGEGEVGEDEVELEAAIARRLLDDCGNY